MEGRGGENVTSKTEQDLTCMCSNETFCLKTVFQEMVKSQTDEIRLLDIIKAKGISLPEIRCVLVKFF